MRPPFEMRLLDAKSARKGTTNNDIAAAAGVTPQTVSEWLNGRAAPRSIDTLIALADFFRVSLDYLTGRVDDPGGKFGESDASAMLAEIEAVIRRSGLTGGGDTQAFDASRQQARSIDAEDESPPRATRRRANSA